MVVMLMMMQQQQTSSALPPPPNPNPSVAVKPPTRDHAAVCSTATTEPLARVRLLDLVGYDGAPAGNYSRAVEALSGSLMRHNAAVVELGSEDTAIMRCGLEAARLYFRSKVQNSSGKGSRGVYMYRAGRAFEDSDSSPPCMADIFRCMGKAARAALCSIARNLRLRSDVFNHLLDDTPLPSNEVSSSVLAATYSHIALQNGKGVIGGGKPSISGEVEKGLLTLISSDSPGLQVCDAIGHYYLADSGLLPGDLLLITGKALSHATAGLRPSASYRAASDYLSGINHGGRTSLAFRLMPQGNAILDCSPIAAVGHVIPQSYVPISVSQFMDDLSAEEDVICSRSDNSCVTKNNLNKEPSLRSVLSDPLSGSFLEDAIVVSCGHSFGGLMLRRVLEMSRCTICNAEIEPGSLIPNLALRAAAAAVKHEDDRRLFHNAALRKRRKKMGDQTDSMRRPNRENGDGAGDDGLLKGVQYPFSVNEKVVIKGNRRTPEKFVGKEAVITSQCLNGWYLLKIIESGENVRLQYRSLKIKSNSTTPEDRCPSQPPPPLQNTIFDRSGRYVITGLDDRLVKIWSMETTFCLTSCRGHERDITDLAVSSNNAMVASAANDFVIRVWRLPDGMPISVLRGHAGAVTAIAFTPRPGSFYQLLSDMSPHNGVRPRKRKSRPTTSVSWTTEDRLNENKCRMLKIDFMHI